MEKITRRLFLRNTAAAGAVATTITVPFAVEAARRRVRDAMEELERLAEQECGGRWSVMLVANEDHVVGGKVVLPLITYRRPRTGPAKWTDRDDILSLGGADG